MSIFQPAISAAVGGRPMPYVVCACAPVAKPHTAIATATPQISRQGIGHLAAISDAPGPDRIVVVEIVLAAHCEKFGQRRLDIAGLVDGTALDHGGPAVPSPRQTEARQGTRQHRVLQSRVLPAPAVID